MSNTLLILFGCLVAVVALAVFLPLRTWLTRRRELWQRRLNGSTPTDLTSGLLQQGYGPQEPLSWTERLDQWFEQTVRDTGLEADPGQVLGMMALLGLLLGGGLFLWRDQWW